MMLDITQEDKDHLREMMNHTDQDQDQDQLTDQTTQIYKTGPELKEIEQGTHKLTGTTQDLVGIKALTDLDKGHGQTPDQDKIQNKPTRKMNKLTGTMMYTQGTKSQESAKRTGKQTQPLPTQTRVQIL